MESSAMMPMRRCTSWGVIELTARRTAAGPCATRVPGTSSAVIKAKYGGEKCFTVRPAFSLLRIGQLAGELGQVAGDAGGGFRVDDAEGVPGLVQRGVESVKERNR